MICRFRNRRSGEVWLVECDYQGIPLELHGRIHANRERRRPLDQSRDYSRPDFDARFVLLGPTKVRA